MASSENTDRKISHRVKKDYRYDIAMLRLLCITIVVFFHAYGMMYANHFSEATASIYRDKYEFFNQTYLINIAMPMFVFISGFLFGGQLLKKQTVPFTKMVKSKFMRLMVPFFVFTTLFMFTQNAVSLKPFYQWTYSHLWFLPMLFWCFISAWLLRPLIMSDKMYVSIPTLIILFAIAIPDKVFPMIIGLHHINTDLCWFALGAWFFKHEKTLIPESDVLKVFAIIIGLTIFGVVMTLFPQEYGQKTIGGIISSISAIYALWILFAWIPWKNFAFTGFLMTLSACSFGIYIFHNWLEAHMVSRTAQRLLNLEYLASEHIYLYPFIFSMLAFAISFGITWILLQFKIGRKLIG